MAGLGLGKAAGVQGAWLAQLAGDWVVHTAPGKIGEPPVFLCPQATCVCIYVCTGRRETHHSQVDPPWASWRGTSPGTGVIGVLLGTDLC